VNELVRMLFGRKRTIRVRLTSLSGSSAVSAATHAALRMRTVVRCTRPIPIILKRSRHLPYLEHRQHAQDPRVKEVIVRLLPCYLLPVQTRT